MNLFKYVLMFCSVVTILSCGTEENTNGSNENHDQANVEDASKIVFDGTVTEALGQQMNSLLASYMAIKDALVAGDSVKVSALGRGLAGSATAIDTVEIKAEDKARWLNRKKQLIGFGLLLEGTSKLEEQRKLFQKLSIMTYEVFTDIGTTNTTIYRQYCPMAFNNNGGYWISTSAEILNPYFGDKMLKCGKIEEVVEFQ